MNGSINEYEQLFYEALDPNNQDQSIIDSLNALKAQNQSAFLLICVDVVLLDDVSFRAAKLGIITIGNILRPSIKNSIEEIKGFYQYFSGDEKVRIKQALFRGLMFNDESIAETSAYSLSYLIQIEYSMRIYTNIISDLNSIIFSDTYCEITRFSALKSIYYILDRRILWVISTDTGKPIFDAFLETFNYVYENVVTLRALPPTFLTMMTKAITKSIHPQYSFRFYYRNNFEVLEKIVQFLFEAFVFCNEDFEKMFFKLLSKLLYLFYKDSISLHQPILTLLNEIVEDGLEYRKNIALQFLKSYAKSLYKITINNSLINIEVDHFDPFVDLLYPLLSCVSQKEMSEDDSNNNSLALLAMDCLSTFMKSFGENLWEKCYEYASQCLASEEWPLVYSGLNALRAIVRIKPALSVIIQDFDVILSISEHSNSMIRESSLLLISQIISECYFFDFELLNEEKSSILTTLCIGQLDTNTWTASLYINLLKSVFDLPYLQVNEDLIKSAIDSLLIYLSSTAEFEDKLINSIIIALISLFKNKSISFDSHIKYIQVIIDKINESILVASQKSIQALICIIGFLAHNNHYIIDEDYLVYITNFLFSINENHHDNFGIDAIFSISYIVRKYRKIKEMNHIIHSIVERLMPMVESLLTTGDNSSVILATFLIKECYSAHPDYLSQIGEELYVIIDNAITSGDVKSTSFPFLLGAHGRIVANMGEGSVQYRDEIINKIKFLIEQPFDAENGGDYIWMKGILEGILECSSELIINENADQAWWKENQKLFISLFKILDPSIFIEESTSSAVLRFARKIVGYDKKGNISRELNRKNYNLLLNCANLIKHLEIIKNYANDTISHKMELPRSSIELAKRVLDRCKRS